MRLDETKEKFFTYKETAEILKSHGLGGTTQNVSFAVKVSKRLERVFKYDKPVITRASLESYIVRLLNRGVK
jgi:hypothetical protein